MTTRTKYDKEAIRRANPIDAYLMAAGHQVRHSGGNAKCRCPFPDHEDRDPSFSIYSNAEKWKCQSGCGSGDIFALHQQLTGCDFPTAAEQLSHGKNIPVIESDWKRRRLRPRPVIEVEPATRPIEWPSDLHSPTGEEIREIAQSRRVSVDALIRAIELGTVLAGTVGDSPSWILTDRTERAAEARRIDGRLYYGKAGFKSYALEESRKDWPVGIDTLVDDKRFSRLLIVEGGTDYLAALHVIEEHDLDDVLPVAILGLGVTRTHPDALASFRGRRIRVVPDVDKPNKPGEGEQWAAAWIRLALDAGAVSADFFRLDGLTRFDGKPVTDLNDAILANAPDVLSALLHF